MNQLDLFNTSHYLYEKLDKIEMLMDRKVETLFLLIHELSNEILEIKKKTRPKDENK